MASTLELDLISTRQQRIAALAKQTPPMAFTSLNHHLDRLWMMVACDRTRKGGAVGIDGQSGEEYLAHLLPNLIDLLERAKSGTYRAPAVRRTYIPKGTNGETRPIGIPTFEDKVLQRAVLMILEPIYEQDFHEGSYGFRPGRSAHQAIDALRNWLQPRGGGWVLEVDIRKFFDTLDHGLLREFVQRRVRDGVLRRLIGKWLNAGVLEDGTLSHPDQGSPQGGVISPLLANIYLHYVLDEWFEAEVKPRMRGETALIRYADDFVIAFTQESDAQRVAEVLPQRLAKYHLQVHPDKTRLVRFVRPHREDRDGGSTSPETFDLLGFTWYWGRTQHTSWALKTKTAADRLHRAIMKIATWCRRFRHRSVPEQHGVLCRKLQGHYGYYGRPGNYYALSQYYRAVRHRWRTWLSRRSWSGLLTWRAFHALLHRLPLPPPRVRVASCQART